MHKKVLIGLMLAIFLIFSFTICYAENGMQKASESAKNVVSGAENAVEGAAKNAGNMVKGAANTVKDGAQNLGGAVMNGVNATGNAIANGANNAKNTVENTFDGNTDNNNYTATRTAGEGTFMGMTSNTWSWLILGIAAIAIIALVWYYSMQLNNSRNHDDNE